MPDTARPRITRVLTAALGLAGLALATFTPPAQAAPVTRVFFEQGVLKVVAGSGQGNAFRISAEPGRAVVEDVFHPITPVGTCKPAPAPLQPNVVSCPITAATTIQVEAGDGNDSIQIYGLAGTLLLGAGDDAMSGATGGLVVDLGPGNDTASPNALQGAPERNGPDEVIGGEGVDTISYAQHFFAVRVSLDDVANDGIGAEGDNIRSDVENIDGSMGNDILVGSAGANTIRGLFGGDQLSGLGGDDTFVEGHFSPPYDKPDTLSGGPGVDTATYAGNSVPKKISLDDVANDGATGEKDDVRSDVENLIGGAGGDELTGSAAANVLIGGAGVDRADGGPGVDRCEAEVTLNCP